MADEIANQASGETSVQQDTQVSAPTVQQDTQVSVQQEAPKEAVKQEHRVYTRDELAKITNAESKKSYEKGIREAQAKYENLLKQQNQQPTTQTNLGGMTQLDAESIRQIYHEESAKKQLVEINSRIANDFLSKVDNAKSKYQDFDKITEDLKIMNLPMQYVQVFNEFDNAGDLLYDLGKNPEKLGQIVPLFYDPVLAKRALKKLSDSIKANEAAAVKPQANPPLSQVSPSPTGVDNGKMSVKDLRKQPWLRA